MGGKIRHRDPFHHGEHSGGGNGTASSIATAANGRGILTQW
jgi:hypothetical protein